jgi:hypothetical protein
MLFPAIYGRGFLMLIGVLIIAMVLLNFTSATGLTSYSVDYSTCVSPRQGAIPFISIGILIFTARVMGFSHIAGYTDRNK